jgi:hypothetical protein
MQDGRRLGQSCPSLTQQPRTLRYPSVAGICRADDGTRTHDLLHGKRVVGSIPAPQTPMVTRFLGAWRPVAARRLVLFQVILGLFGHWNACIAQRSTTRRQAGPRWMRGVRSSRRPKVWSNSQGSSAPASGRFRSIAQVPSTQQVPRRQFVERHLLCLVTCRLTRATPRAVRCRPPWQRAPMTLREAAKDIRARCGGGGVAGPAAEGCS